MRIALVAGGHVPIPPQGWGAVENIIWNYKNYLEALGHTIDIYNTFMYEEIICAIEKGNYDFVHTHYAPFCLAFNKHLKRTYCATTHYGRTATYIKGSYDPLLDIIFADVLEAPGNIVLSEAIKELFLQKGYSKFLRVLRNPVETQLFRFSNSGNGKAICLGKIEVRKRQALLAQLVQGKVMLDFVGPYQPDGDSVFQENDTCTYRGHWSKEQVYRKLTDYNCLVLLSESEVAPLVVLEGLAAGLSIVVTRCASANLTNEEFITILPDDEKDPYTVSSVIQSAIDKNNVLRKTVRAYAYERFDYSIVVKDYLKIIREFQQHSSK